jgi:hypothetical protein
MNKFKVGDIIINSKGWMFWGPYEIVLEIQPQIRKELNSYRIKFVKLISGKVGHPPNARLVAGRTILKESLESHFETVSKEEIKFLEIK